MMRWIVLGALLVWSGGLAHATGSDLWAVWDFGPLGKQETPPTQFVVTVKGDTLPKGLPPLTVPFATCAMSKTQASPLACRCQEGDGALPGPDSSCARLGCPAPGRYTIQVQADYGKAGLSAPAETICTITEPATRQDMEGVAVAPTPETIPHVSPDAQTPSPGAGHETPAIATEGQGPAEPVTPDPGAQLAQAFSDLETTYRAQLQQIADTYKHALDAGVQDRRGRGKKRLWQAYQEARKRQEELYAKVQHQWEALFAQYQQYVSSHKVR